MPSYAYFQKKFMPLADAKMNVMTNCIHYGTAIFEGIRGNWNPEKKQMYIFRIREHYERLLSGCKVLLMDIPYTANDLCRITVELAQKCGLEEDVYIRPLAYKSSEQLGVKLHNLDADFLCFIIPWGRYLDVETAKCGVSSWRRSDDNAIPPQIKVAGIYGNNAFAETEAVNVTPRRKSFLDKVKKYFEGSSGGEQGREKFNDAVRGEAPLRGGQLHIAKAVGQPRGYRIGEFGESPTLAQLKAGVRQINPKYVKKGLRLYKAGKVTRQQFAEGLRRELG